MAGLGLALTLVGLGAQAFGMQKSADEMNRVRAKLLERSNSLDDVFNKEYNQNYMETPSVKNTIAAYTKGLKDVNKNVEGRAAMAGGTPEAVIAERDKVNQNYGGFIQKVGAGQDAYRADTKRLYDVRRDVLDNQIYNSDLQKASQWDNFVKNAGNLGVAGISAGAIQNEGTTGNWFKDFLAKQKKNTQTSATVFAD
jgi:hypothetical protein